MTKAQVERRREVIKDMLELRQQGTYATVKLDKLVVLNEAEEKKENGDMITTADFQMANTDSGVENVSSVEEASSSPTTERDQHGRMKYKNKEKQKSNTRKKTTNKSKIKTK